MKVRFFTADSIQEAMAQVKNVLGRDAIILHTRTFRKGGILGFFTKEKVEVMAAIDTPQAAVSPAAAPAVQTAPKAARVAAPAAVAAPAVAVQKDEELAAVQSELASMRELLEQALHKKTAHNNSQMQNENENLAAMQKELAHMRGFLEDALNRESSPDPHKYPVLELLLNNDVEAEIAEKILKIIPLEQRKEELSNSELQVAVVQQIKEKMQNISGIKVPAVGRKVVAFIGPTGVGKTTTIAKLAAKFAIQDRYNVALVTADTYRVSAVQQLTTYSDIMAIPINVVYTAAELKRVLDCNLDKQLVLIDTAGRSPHNEDQLDELEKLLQIDDTIEKHLVLSATTRYKDSLDIVEKFSRCSPDKIIFTKLDEARNIGTILNLLYHTSLPLSYITNGQNVPDDIELVDSQKLAHMIFRK